MKLLENKTAIVTGGSGGLGKAISERYASLGANIVVHYMNNKEKAEKTVANIQKMGVQAIAVQADTTKVQDIKKLFKTAKEKFGTIDIVVANAGIELADIPVLEFTEEQFDELFALMLKELISHFARLRKKYLTVVV